ncbi:MAG: acetate kinase [Cereibacter sphaeroides]|uniref:Acetate kinase n=1 Tax=Cereibacter sphaeroides TaxID=1063 RepID=A0A2W5UAE4_CERSP|nr:MAG: acetate kinase [Cereibacter sphaeroides]
MTDQAILTLNAGSSSLKLALYAATGDAAMATGLIDRIGAEGSLRLRDASGADIAVETKPADFASHAAALRMVLAALDRNFDGLRIVAVGHRVVHGGPDHDAPILLDTASIDRLEKLNPLAPLHQPHNIAGIRAAHEAFPEAAQIACFDTAFHRAQPFVNDTYALPREYYDRGVRRYGFHGLSYEYISGEMARSLPELAKGRVVVAHLGNGASMCAIAEGRPVSTTMGFSALDGLAMGTRTGQIDPGVLLYLLDHEKLSLADLSDLLYRRSGLLGMSGLSNDMRTLEASDDPNAKLAIDYFVTRIRRETASLAAAMGGIDALIFCGGIGENSRLIRASACEGLDWMGITLDPTRNQRNEPEISAEASPVKVLVMPTNEELVIARATRRLAIGTERTAA